MSPTHPRRRRPLLAIRWLFVGALLLISGLAGCSGCLENVGKGAAQELAEAATESIGKLPDIIEQIDTLLANNIDQLDEAMAHNIQEASRALRSQLEGVQALVEGSVGAIDTALAARIQQLEEFALGLLKEVDDILAGRIEQLTYSAERLIQQSTRSVIDILESAGWVVGAQVERAGDVAFQVLGRAVEGLLITVALVVLVLVLIFTGLFFIIRKSPAPQSWIPFVSVQGVIAVGALLILLVPSVRLAMAGDTLTVKDDSAVCTQALADAAVFAGVTDRAAMTTEQRQILSGVYVGLLECTAAFVPSDLKGRAWSRIAELEALMGLDSHCRRNEQCDARAGLRCDVATGLCTDRCARDGECPSGTVCHALIGVCHAPCAADADCNEPGRLRCNPSGRCVAVGGQAPPDDDDDDAGGVVPGGIRIDPGILDRLRKESGIIGRTPGPYCLSCPAMERVTPTEPRDPTVTPRPAEVRIELTPALRDRSLRRLDLGGRLPTR